MFRLLFFTFSILIVSCGAFNRSSYIRVNLKNSHSDSPCVEMKIRLGVENPIVDSVCSSDISTDYVVHDLLVPKGEILISVEIEEKGIMLDTLFHTDTVKSVYISYIGRTQKITERRLDFEGKFYVLNDTLKEIPEQLTFVTFNRIPIEE